MRGCALGKRKFPARVRRVFPILLSVLLFVVVLPAWAGQAATTQAGTTQVEPSIPDAPQPQPVTHAKTAVTAPCHTKKDPNANAQTGVPGAVISNPANPAQTASPQPGSCPPLAPLIDWYARFLNGPQVKRLTPKQKAWLATRNVIDPFNAITILGNSAIYVGANSHSGYGPGMSGFEKNVGVSYAQDMTGEFFGTFLIPSLVHQDPHYHRLPNASMKHRIFHAIYQVAWTQGDDGKGMLNYGNLVGFALDDEISNLYVPGRQTDLPASASRYAIGLGLAPIDNFITEFVPDVAKRIHIRVVLVQRIINQVATSESGGQ
jgi:hypothetical protein